MSRNLAAIIVGTLACLLALGHGGRTDSSGGHNDRKNGGYHYHNSGKSSRSSTPSMPRTGATPGGANVTEGSGPRVQEFFLRWKRNGKRYGPFRCVNGTQIVIGKEVLHIEID